MLPAVIAICTRNRTTRVTELLDLLQLQGNRRSVLIIDSSDTDNLANAIPATSYPITYIHTLQRSLARQRNIALSQLSNQMASIVHFIDDDSRPMEGYFDALESALSTHQELGGVGGTVINQDLPRMLFPKRVFRLYSRHPGRVLRSGRNTIGHYPETGGGRVDWLPGCAMSYRLDMIENERFDARLQGYSWGEDLDFSFRLGRKHPLEIVPQARLVHLVVPENRTAAAQLASQRTVLLHRWVSERRGDGLSLALFWWSVFGEILLRVCEGLVRRDRLAAAIGLGVAKGAIQIGKK